MYLLFQAFTLIQSSTDVSALSVMRLEATNSITAEGNLQRIMGFR